MGKILDVTMRCARLKLWSISTDCELSTSQWAEERTLEGECDGLLQLFQFLGQSELPPLCSRRRASHGSRKTCI